MTTRSTSEEELFTRPRQKDIRSAWTELFSEPLLSLASLKATALTKPGLGESSPGGGIILRSLYWRFYHGLLPSPTSLNLFPSHLESTRFTYSALRRRYLVAPDGRWAADCSGSDEYDPSLHPGPSRQAEWDPLSLDGGSPWKAWFAHLDLRNTIRQDVERTFPDIPYFQLERVRRSLVTSLFLFAVLNPDVGYRQGMHELLAVCFLALDLDSLEPPSGPSQRDPLSPTSDKPGIQDAMMATLDRRYIEHDAFGLFQEIMKGAKPFYEWRAEEGPKSKSPAALPAPIITRCNHIHNSLLRRIDPQLWERLETEGVEAQIWAIRWLRLILTRELPFPLALRIWDGVFTEDPGLGILDLICVAMLLLIRNELLEADYPTLLTHLLHYPAPSTTYPFSPSLILSQAQFLRDNISPASGVHVVIQNQEMLGVQAQPPERAEETASVRRRGDLSGRGGMRGRSQRGPQGMQGLAAGLFERAQAAGLDKAILSTVADLRKNLPDSTTAYGYLPNPFSPVLSPAARDAATPFSSLPTSAPFPYSSTNPTSPSTISARPPIQARRSGDSDASVKLLRDAERELAELRLAMVGMGKAMEGWLSTISGPPGETVERFAASSGLERVRDTLLDAAGKDVDDIVKEWGWHDGLQAPRSHVPTPIPTPPSISNDAPDHFSKSDEIVFDAGEITPTIPSFPILVTEPSVNGISSASHSAPLEGVASGPVPGIQSSTRADKPSAALPRVPMTAPVHSSAKASKGWSTRQVATQSGETAAKEDERLASASRRNEIGDPLAGLGIEGVRSDVVRRPPGSASSARDGGVDPLLGVGVR